MLLLPIRSRRAVAAFLHGIVGKLGKFINNKLTLSFKNPMLLECVRIMIEENYQGLVKLKQWQRKLELLPIEEDGIEKFLTELKIITDENDAFNFYSSKTEYSIALLRGAFLAAGSISLSQGYHLEFALKSTDKIIEKLLIKEDFIPKKINKNNNTTQLLYYKNSETISDLLAYLGAPQMALALHSLIVERETERRMRRIANCDEANINKIVTLARSHIAAIEKLEKTNKLERLPQKLLETAVLRKENPELSIEELALLAGLSKSGMRHRLDKLMEIAQD